VRLKMAGMTMTVGMALLVTAIFAPLPIAANPVATIRILFDLGDGTYVWASQTIADPNATNATWNAVQQAAMSYYITIDHTWYTCCGVAISDLGGRHNPGGFVGLLKWNSTAGSWRFTTSGISGLVVQDGDAIALSNAAFASVPPYAGRTPVPTPIHPRPWTEFRGDLANSGAAASAAPDRVSVLWDLDTGKREIGSSPAVAYGRVYVTTMGGMFAIDQGNGLVGWTNPKAKGFSSPAVFNDSLYVGTSSGTVLRLNASDGSEVWETRLLSSTVFSGITSSPKVVFDRVYVGTFNETGGAGEVVALWEGNGSVVWRHATASVHFSSPAYADGTVYIGVMGRYNTTSQVSFDPPYGVLALDAATGDQRWFFPTTGSVAASPAVLGRNLIAPAKDGKVYAINRTTGALVWGAPAEAGISSPAVFGDTVFVGGGAFGSPGRVAALDAASGTVKWSYAPNGPVQSSLTYAEGTIVFATNEDHGTIYALNATSGSVRWSYEPFPSEYILGSPIVADGVVFAPSDNGHVYALAVAGPGGPSPLGFDPVVLGAILVAAVAGIGIAVWIAFGRRPRGGV